MELLEFLYKFFLFVVWACIAMLLGIIVGMWWGDAARSQTPDRVDVALVLALDHSTSVEAPEWKLQLEGYAAAFRSPQVKASIASGSNQRIAVTMFRWSDYDKQETLIGWTILSTPEDADMFAAQILQYTAMPSWNGTCIAGALAFAKERLDELSVKAERRVVDVSGDENESCGPNGPYASQVRDLLVYEGVQINGLPILTASVDQYAHSSPYGYGGDPNERTYNFYRDNVIGGPGAFLIAAEGFEKFAEAVQRKLLLEIAANEKGE